MPGKDGNKARAEECADLDPSSIKLKDDVKDKVEP